MRLVSVRAAAAAGLLAVLGATAAAQGAAPPPEGANLAPLSAYAVTPKPNADYAPERSGRELSDGVRASGRFWSGGRSIGWENKSPIRYRQRFAAETPLRTIEIGTGRNARSSISLPSQALVYVAGDDGRFGYVGDAASARPDGAGEDGMATLRLDIEPVLAREIVIVLYRAGTFLFLDEVRLLSAARGERPSGALSADAIEADAAWRRRAEAEARAGQGPLGSDPARRFAWPLPPRPPGTGEAGCAVTRISPWTEGTAAELLAAPRLSDAPAAQTVGGHLVAAFRVENRSDAERRVTVSHAAVDGAGGPRTAAVHYVLGLDHRWRADVVVATDSVALPARSFGLVMIEAPIARPGDIRLAAMIGCGEDRATFDLAARALPLEPAGRPYGTLWSYLEAPTARVAGCWPSFHEDVGVDTAVVNEQALNRRLNRRAEALLRTYLRTFAKARRILLYMEMTDPSWPSEPDARMEAELRDWWAWVAGVIRQEGIRSEIVLYPVDEVRAAQVGRLNAIARILRRVAPGVPIYGTVGDASLIPAVELDKIQAIERALPTLSADLTQRKEIQVYDTKPLGKALSPTNYYRRISWQAFGASLKGSGVWSMWDSSGAASPERGWSDFGGSERDFGLIYGSAEGCVHPSRRLLAWRQGLEDFAVLEACRRQSPARDLRPEVRAFSRPEDRTAAAYDERLAALTASCMAAAATGPGPGEGPDRDRR